MNRHESWLADGAKSAQPLTAVVNLDVEQGVLGALLLGNPGLCVHWVAKIDPEDFSEGLHARIFAAIKASVACGQMPTPILLNPHFAGEQVGGITVPAYLGRLCARAASTVVLGSYFKALREMRVRRDLMTLGEQTGLMAANPASDLSEGAAQIVGELDNLRAMLRERRPSLFSLDEAASATVAALRQPKDSIRTGLVSLDNVLGGWHRREFSVVAARPSMGKSAFLFSTLLQAAKRGTTALIFSLEMPIEAATMRMLSDLVWNTQTPIPYVNIMRGKIQDYEVGRLEAAAQKYRALPLYIDDQAGLTTSEIHARAKRAMEILDRKGQRLDVIAVDHLGKVRASDRYAGNKVNETGETSNAFTEMAKDLDVAVVAAHQLSRAVEGRENKRPGLPDLRNTGDIEQDAETVMFLYRPAYYLRTREDSVAKEDERKAQLAQVSNTLEVDIAKNRNGPCLTLDLFADLPSNVIRDLAAA